MTTLQNMTIAFIGAGNMGQALIEGCLQSGMLSKNIIVVEPDLSKHQALADLGIHIFTEAVSDLKRADIVLFCVKPNQMKATITEVNPFLNAQIVVSIAAGVLIDTIQSCLLQDLIVIRAMPNTPATIESGMTALYTNRTIDENVKNVLSAVFDAVGKTVWLSCEEKMNAVTAISGSGPAYFFYLMNAMIEGAKLFGFSQETAQELVKQTAFGAASLASQSNISCEELQKRVMSKGGTTEAAIAVFESERLAQIVQEAMNAAFVRSQQMSQEYK